MDTNKTPNIKELVRKVHVSAENQFRAQCDAHISEIMTHAQVGLKDKLPLLFSRLFNGVYPNRIELAFDGEYLNPKIDRDSKKKLIDKDDDVDFVIDVDHGFYTKNEYLDHIKIEDPEDEFYTFKNKDILIQTTFLNLIKNYTGSEIAVYRVDETPIIILGDTEMSIIYHMDHFIYVLRNEPTLSDFIKKNVAVEEEDSVRYFEYVVYDSHGFDTTSLPVKKQNIDIEKNYNDDLPHEEIVEFLESDDSGLCILYGAPGTGKTSYIRHLMHNCKDVDFMILNTSCFDAINDSSFVNMIINNKDAVVILEDCEDLMIERNTGGNSRIATLLNLSDGILGDALRLKFICTFNSKISKIDSAVLRKGRTHVKYEFKPLCKEKARALAEEIGHTLPAKKGNEGYTLAEIYYSDNNLVDGNVTSKVGF